MNRRWSVRRVGALMAAFVVLVVLAAACGAPGGDEEVAGEDIGSAAPTGATSESSGAASGAAGASSEATAAPSEGGSTATGEVSGEPIQVGFLAATTGTAASSGQDMVRGWDLYWKLNGSTVAGREIVTTHEDTAGDPATGRTKAQRLVNSVGVDLVVGPLLANVGLAVGDYLSAQGVPNFQHVASADDLTQRTPLDGVLRVGGWTSSQTAHPMGQYALDQGYKRIVTICTDYAFGHENCGGFTNVFTDGGGEVVEQLWNPLGTQDFGTYMAQIQAADPDAVFAAQVGGDSVRFIESWNSFGLKDSDIQLLGGETLLDQSLLRNMGPEAEGLISTGKFSEGLDREQMTKFVQEFDDAYGDLPSYYATDSFVAAQWTAEALEQVDGNIEDTEPFLAAVRDITIDAPTGELQLDEYDNPIQPVFIREVQTRDDGRMWNVPIKTYEDVSQFWTYDPQEFLAHPVYSRDYQGNGVWPDPTN